MPRPWVVKESPREWSIVGLSEESELVWKLTVAQLPLWRLPSPLLSCPSLGFALCTGLVTGSVLCLYLGPECWLAQDLDLKGTWVFPHAGHTASLTVVRNADYVTVGRAFWSRDRR